MIFQKGLEELRKRDILEINLKIIRYFGLLQDESVNKTRFEKVTVMAKQIIITLLITQYFLGTSVELYLSLSDMYKAGNCIIYFITSLKNMAKLGTVIINRKKFLSLLINIDKNRYVQGITPTEAQRSIVQSYIDLSKKTAKWVWILCFMALISLIINQPPQPNLELIIDPDEMKDLRRGSSIKMWLPFRAIESPYFEMSLVYEDITMTIYFIFITAINVTIVDIIIKVSAQFAVLAEAVQSGVTPAAGLPYKKRGETGTGVPSLTNKQTNKQTPWPSVRERTIPTERPPLVDEI
jgi:hypothetical protein